jgi:hypothetical protein
VNDCPALVGEDDRNVEQPKRCGHHDEHVDGRDAFGVIPQEGAPGRGRRTSSSHHVLGDRSLTDLDAELEQFTMDPRSTPERVGAAHLPNQVDCRPELERQRQNKAIPDGATGSPLRA